MSYLEQIYGREVWDHVSTCTNGAPFAKGIRVMPLDVPEVAVITERHTMESAPYDILRRQDNAAIWLETSPDLRAAKARIKDIVSFWPGKYEVVDHRSQQIVASISTPAGLRACLSSMSSSADKSLSIIYEWLLAPAPRVAGMAAYNRMQKYARGWYQSSCDWLRAPVERVLASRSR
jgi:hypothetical protein